MAKAGYDAVIVGGGFAGLSAAMQLARARRRIAVIDAGAPRNRFAKTSHGFFGQDGKAPAEIFAEARRQVAAYPTVTLIEDEARDARLDHDGFSLSLSSGAELQARRLVLAPGLTDTPPPIPGLPERWGLTVLHCPYCHGYETADRPLGVLATGAMAAHQAAMLPDWGPTTFFTQGAFEPDAEHVSLFAARGVRIERTPIVAVLGPTPRIDAVKLADDRLIELAAIFTASETKIASPLADQLGCVQTQGPLGLYIQVDGGGATSVPGVFAAGDAASPMHNATIAASSGVIAGVGAHKSLVFSGA